ncbi:unnamed protein product, partial [Ilex paraguariensis]
MENQGQDNYTAPAEISMPLEMESQGQGFCVWDGNICLSGKVKDGSNGYVAADSYHLFKEDAKIMKKIGLKAYRFSISWSRMLPNGKLSGGVNKEGIKYYNNLIDELLANGIEPFVTLFHCDLPQSLQDEYGGFISAEIVVDFCNYAELCFWEFGDRVKHWITLNEPVIYSMFGYALGTFPPGRGHSSPENKDSSQDGDAGKEPYLVSHNLLLVHAAAKSQKGKIGITLASEWMEPLDDQDNDDVEAAERALDFLFGWSISGNYERKCGFSSPKFTKEQSKKLKKGSYDFLGLNYYTASYVTSATDPKDGRLSYVTDSHVRYTCERDGVPIGPQGGSGWLYACPKGIYKILVHIKENYDDPLIYVTENGFDEATNPNLTLSEARVDKMRIEYLQDHLHYIKNAIDMYVFLSKSYSV